MAEIEINPRVRRTDLRTDIARPERVYTNPRRPRIIETNFGRLGDALGGLTRDAFRAFDAGKRDVTTKIQELALANPDKTETEILRESGVSSFYSATASAAFGSVDGKRLGLQARNQVKESLPDYVRENPDAELPEINSFINTSFDEIINQNSNLTARAIAQDVSMNRDLLISETLNGLAVQRKDAWVEASVSLYEEGVNSGLADPAAALSVVLSEDSLLSVQEREDLLPEIIKIITKSENFSTEAATNLSTFISEKWSDDPEARITLLDQVESADIAREKRELDQKNLEDKKAENLWKNIVLGGGELTEDKKNSLSLEQQNNYEKSLLEYRINQNQMKPLEFRKFFDSLIDGSVSLNDLMKEKVWTDMSPAQQKKIWDEPLIAGYADRKQMTEQDAKLRQRTTTSALSALTGIDTDHSLFNDGLTKTTTDTITVATAEEQRRLNRARDFIGRVNAEYDSVTEPFTSFDWERWEKIYKRHSDKEDLTQFRVQKSSQQSSVEPPKKEEEVTPKGSLTDQLDLLLKTELLLKTSLPKDPVQTGPRVTHEELPETQDKRLNPRRVFSENPVQVTKTLLRGFSLEDQEDITDLNNSIRQYRENVEYFNEEVN